MLIDRYAAMRLTLAACLLALLASCGQGGSNGPQGPSGINSPPGSPSNALSADPPPAPAAGSEPGAVDAARFLTQATFGVKSADEADNLRKTGFERWMWDQFREAPMSHMDYIRSQKSREINKDNLQGRLTEEMSYEAVWQQWLNGKDQLRSRMAFALNEIVVISNIAPDLEPEAMSSYMDMLNRNAFGSYRQLLEDVTLHPAMGYYLNMLKSEKEDTGRGIRPNENYAREILQLFSIGLVKLNLDGTVQKDASGKDVPTYDDTVVQGFAKAFSGWSFAGADTTKANMFDDVEDNWTDQMKAWPAKHSPGEKKLLDGKMLPAGQTPEKDMKDALDNVFNHPNVGPFVGRQLIQRFVTSNPSPAYIQRVAQTFNDNGGGMRGDLKATLRAVLVDPEARDISKINDVSFGKQREPVIRLANFLRAFNAKSKSGINEIHYLDSADNALGQSPLLSPTVFNFFSPNYKHAGRITQAGLYSPEFQITTETSVVGSLNFFGNLINQGGYGGGDDELKMDFGPLKALAGDPAALTERMNKLLYAGQMRDATRATLTKAITGIDANDKDGRVRAALILTAIAPDYVIQK
jgi:uncharacterized protein (DUF1800 family)